MIAAVYELGPSLTYSRRDAVWLKAGEGWYGDPRDGTLTIRLQPGRRRGGKVECDSYAVERHLTHNHPPECSVFLLSNLTDPDQSEVYECVIAARPEDDRCTCTAGRVDHYRCKHRCALRAIVEDLDQTF